MSSLPPVAPVPALAAEDARKLRVRARRDVSTLLGGAYRSAFRGRGLTFEELRDYVPGDDVRWMEWNATARQGRPVVKLMREERDLLVVLIMDRSKSLRFGSGSATKADAVRRVAAAIATAATRAGDRLAFASFADRLLDVVEPSSGPMQLERVLGHLGEPVETRHTCADTALDWAADRLPRHSVVVLLSDFHFADPDASLRRCAHQHELVGLRITDRADTPPRTAPVRIRGAEGGRAALWSGRRGQALALAPERWRRAGGEYAEVRAASPIEDLLHFFEVRSGARA